MKNKQPQKIHKKCLRQIERLVQSEQQPNKGVNTKTLPTPTIHTVQNTSTVFKLWCVVVCCVHFTQ